ncbi:MAG TPA: hypothetical protein VFJ72_07715 [Rubrobacteraceae bacterium]|nr:hypothetical protein [Rubrobacteraceae bacterium]
MSEATKQQAPVISGHQVIAAGLASTTAAIITSRFGVAGTLLGAAVTSMIITGGSAILRSYLESVTGSVRKMPYKMKAKANRAQAGRADAPDTIPGRPDLRENFMGRMRAAMGWFSHLPTLRRRSIMLKGFVAAAVAFVIGMSAVYAVESGIGNSLSCGFWSQCPEGAAPGLHVISGRGTGTSSSISFARPQTETAPQNETVNPSSQDASQQQDSSQQDSGTPVVQDPAAGDPSATPETPTEDPAAQPETPATPSETPTATPQAPTPSSGTSESSP